MARFGLIKMQRLAAENQGGTITLNGNVDTSSGATKNLTVDGTGTVSFQGPLTNGVASLNKSGSGRAELHAANSHAGSTIVSEGSLALVGSATVADSPSIEIASGGTLEVSGLSAGHLELAPGQTLRGEGLVVGNVIAGPGSVISPGELSGAGTTNVQLRAFRDVRLRSSSPNSNQGGSNWLAVGSINGNDAFRTVVEFQLDSIPADAVIMGNPTLSLTGAANSGSDAGAPTTNLEVYQLLQDFFEGTATWTSAKSGETWTDDGTPSGNSSPGGSLGSLLAAVLGPEASSFASGDCHF